MNGNKYDAKLVYYSIKKSKREMMLTSETKARSILTVFIQLDRIFDDYRCIHLIGRTRANPIFYMLYLAVDQVVCIDR